ncbi:unnamed protein product [Staurois parvus]|uniref:Uncharacterized protein n=1 Tax=Staurois parvus TaxID=386267 RepID=A0ABN9BQP7_9NEOB|nr:unnamed protein product [Staurois parvus]
MIGVSLCPEDTAGTGSRCCALPGSAHKQVQCKWKHVSMQSINIKH